MEKLVRWRNVELREKGDDWISELVELCLLFGLSLREVAAALWAFFFFFHYVKTEDIH